MLIVCFGILWCIGCISGIYSNDDYFYTNIQVTLLSRYVCLFVCLFFYVPLENISRKWRHHPFRWFGHWSEPSAFEKRGSFIIYLQLLFVCFFVCCYTFRSRISYSHVDFTPADDLRSSRRHWPLTREGAFLSNTWCDRGPRFMRYHPKDRSISVAFYDKQGVLRIYTHSDAQGTHLLIISYDKWKGW